MLLSIPCSAKTVLQILCFSATRKTVGFLCLYITYTHVIGEKTSNYDMLSEKGAFRPKDCTKLNFF